MIVLSIRGVDRDGDVVRDQQMKTSRSLYGRGKRYASMALPHMLPDIQLGLRIVRRGEQGCGFLRDDLDRHEVVSRHQHVYAECVLNASMQRCRTIPCRRIHLP